MAKATFLELCQTVQRECGVSGDPISTVVGNVGELLRVVQWTALADYETQQRWFDWDFMHIDTWTHPTVAGTAAVAAPSNLGMWDIDSFTLDGTTATWSPLAFIEYSDWRYSFKNGVKTNSRPSMVTIKPDLSLMLEPPPDAIYTLRADYWRRPTKMTVDASTSLIPEEFERIIVARAKIAYAEYEAAQEVMSGAQVEFDDLLDKMEAKYLSMQKDRRTAMGDITVRVV